MILLKLLFNLSILGVLALAIPTSILEDLKDAKLQSPIRANKVKRAQEFIMFGNQQNRGPSANFGNVRNEKRATEIQDNSLSEDEGPLPQVLPETEESSYENNHLTSGKSYPYTSRDLYYNMLLRNLELTQNLHNDPVFNYEYPAYSMLDSRNKRDTKATKDTHKPLYRSKRQHVLNPEEFLALMRMADNEKDTANKYYRDRSSVGWPIYESDIEDFPGVDDDEDNAYESDSPDENGGWYNTGRPYQSRFSQARDGYRNSRDSKKLTVSKRMVGNNNGLQYSQQLFGPYDRTDGIPLYRRYLV